MPLSPAPPWPGQETNKSEVFKWTPGNCRVWGLEQDGDYFLLFFFFSYFIHRLGLEERKGCLNTFVMPSSKPFIQNKSGQSIPLVSAKSGQSIQLVTERSELCTELVSDKSGQSIQLVSDKSGQSIQLVSDKSGQSIQLVSDKSGQSIQLVTERSEL